MSRLTDLANKHQTDKGTTFARGAYGPLGYAEHYERLFEPFRLKAIRLLEIGVAEGGSLRMWREFFPNAAIVGLDAREVPPVDGCHVVQGNQGKPSTLFDLGRDYGPFDIVIDDGSHKYQDQFISFSVLYRHCMNAGGLYCIEDLQADFNNGETREYFRKYALWPTHFIADENIVVIEKG